MYPFGDINRELHRQLADKIYNVETAKDSCDGESTKGRSITEEAVFVGISYLMEQKAVDCGIFNFAGKPCYQYCGLPFTQNLAQNCLRNCVAS